jgi:hypothetical protein
MDPLDTIKHHLENTDDATLLILRAHLLVEERLREILARMSRSPDELLGARLSFYQVLMLCLARLNEVRNRMAHHLDPGDLDELLGSVVEKLGPGYTERFKTPADRFCFAAFYACGYFDAIRGSIRLREAYAPEDEV